MKAIYITRLAIVASTVIIARTAIAVSVDIRMKSKGITTKDSLDFDPFI